MHCQVLLNLSASLVSDNFLDIVLFFAEIDELTEHANQYIRFVTYERWTKQIFIFKINEDCIIIVVLNLAQENLCFFFSLSRYK